jgi:Rne/Rng family ribonuclease
MKKSLVISEQDSIGAILENDKAVEFFVNRGELLLGDIYTATVENILPGIDAAFVNLGKDKMGFLHANDVPGQGPLKERLVPKQKLLVQITKEPTGHKGPRVSTAISLPGRFLVLVPEERGVSISRRISETRERSRLKSVVNLMKPPGIGLIIRTEAKGQGENELFEDFEQLWDRWQTVVSDGEASIGPTLIYRDQDLLYRVIRDAYSHDVVEIIVDTQEGQRRAQEYLEGWASKLTKINYHYGEESLLVSKGIDREIEAALSDRVELPSGGHLNIEPTEALTVIDVNSGRFTSSRTQAETVRRTNLEAAQEISRQLRLRNIGGMVIVDFIDMDSRRDQQQVLEVFQRTLEEDRAKPQVGQLSDLGLVELTRRRQGQSLRELFTVNCDHCAGHGFMPTLELGPPESRKIISLKGKDVDLLGRGKGQQRRAAAAKAQATVLRAATATNGRILPTVEEAQGFEETLESLPEHILEQLPDDLLDGKPALGKRGFSEDGLNNDSHGGNDHESPDGEEEELSFAPAHAKARPQFERGHQQETNLHEENLSDDQSDLSNHLIENISAVEKVYHEMDQSASPARSSTYGISNRYEPQQEFESAQAEPDDSEATTLQMTNETVLETVEEPSVEEPTSEFKPSESVAEKPELAPAAYEVPESESPFETEIDPVTGVYRLKAKPAVDHEDETNSSNGQEDSGEGRSLDRSVPQLEAAKSIFQSTYWHNQEAGPEGQSGEPHHSEPDSQTSTDNSSQLNEVGDRTNPFQTSFLSSLTNSGSADSLAGEVAGHETTGGEEHHHGEHHEHSHNHEHDSEKAQFEQLKLKTESDE